MAVRKILIVSQKFVAGGEERDMVDLIKNFDRSRWKACLCVFESTGDFMKEVPKDVELFDLGKRSRWDAPAIALRLSGIINRVKPDIILTSLWYSTAITTVARLFCRHKFKIAAREPHNSKQDRAALNLRDFASRFSIDFCHRRADVVIAVSKGAALDIQRSYGLKAGKARFIYSSVDIAKIKRMAGERLRFKKNRIVTLGRLVHRKGFDSLIRSFAKVKSEVKDAELVIIGKGEERYNLERIVKELGLRDSVKIAGFLENPYSIIAASDAFVCSSLWEGFGKVIIEAMVCGAPVISTRCNFGPEEILTDGVDGLLVPVGDDAAMAEAMLKLLANEDIRNRIGKAGEKRAEDFSVEKNVSEHEIIFTELTEGDDARKVLRL